MKRSALFVCALALLPFAASAWAQTIAAGPLYNPATDARYYRIQGGNYTQLQAFARAMGGDLTTIDNAAENTWVANNLAASSKPFIGLNDVSIEGTFAWSDGSASAFRSWRVGEPNNSAARDCVRLAGPTGEWEVVTPDLSTEAIVEIKGRDVIRVPSEQPTIQSGVLAAAAIGASEVLIAPGTYDVPTSIAFANILLTGSGRDNTFMNAPANATPFILNGSATLADMTISGRSNLASVVASVGFNRVRGVNFRSLPGHTTHTHLQVFGNDSSLVSVENCSFVDGQIAFSMWVGHAHCVNSLFRDLDRVSFDATSSATTLRFSNATFTRIGPSPMFDPDASTTITNSIFHANPGTLDSAIAITFSLLGTARAGLGNVVGSPFFTDAAANDFSLLPASPAIDAGYLVEYLLTSPQDVLDLAGQPRFIDAPGINNALRHLTPIDMGAFEYQPPAPIDTCKPDFNEDGFVDDTDFVTFAQYYDLFNCP